MSKLTPAIDTDKRAIREGYAQALVDLNQIQTTDLNTDAKKQAAIKANAAIIEKILKFIKNRMIQ